MLFAPNDKRSIIRDHIRGTPIIDLLSTISKSGIHSDASDASDVTKRANADLQENYDPYLKPKSTIEYESRGAYIESPQVLTLSGKRVNNLIRGRIYRYTYTVRFECNASNVRFGMLIKTISGVELGGAISAGNLSNSIQMVLNGSRVQVEFQFKCILNKGIYFLNAGVSAWDNGSEIHLHRLLDIEMFRVLPNNETMAIGDVDFECSPNVIFI
jgi:lipopolysaccharide transport system ATP-binding protein